VALISRSSVSGSMARPVMMPDTVRNTLAEEGMGRPFASTVYS
jgi:hypothetical protein